MLFEIVVVITSFLVGYAMKRGGLCTYVAVLQIVNLRHAERLFDFLGAAAWAALAVVTLSWWLPSQITLSGTHDQISMAVLGGLVLGLGAYVNKGCIFGTFVQLVGGNLTYFATLAGISMGVIITESLLSDFVPNIHQNSLVAKPNLVGLIWLLTAGLFALAMLFQIRYVNVPGRAGMPGLRFRSWPTIFIMLILGIGGGLLFATVGGWDFATVLTNTTLKTLDPVNAGPGVIAIRCTLAMVAGGIFAAVSNGTFAIQAPRLLPSLGCLAGGALMGTAAYVIPGGNDGMLLKGIPSLAPHAIIGFVFMVFSMWFLFKGFPNSRIHTK